MLPAAVRQALADHLVVVKAQHEADLASGRGAMALPAALARKASRVAGVGLAVGVFPARFYVDGDTRERRRHHLRESVVQRGGEGRGAGHDAHGADHAPLIARQMLTALDWRASAEPLE